MAAATTATAMHAFWTGAGRAVVRASTPATAPMPALTGRMDAPRTRAKTKRVAAMPAVAVTAMRLNAGRDEVAHVADDVVADEVVFDSAGAGAERRRGIGGRSGGLVCVAERVMCVVATMGEEQPAKAGQNW